MLVYMLKRVGMMIPTLMVISMISFAVIQLPPGDYLTSYVANLRQEGDSIDEAELEMLRRRYGLGQPIYVQYGKWISGILLRGDWGQSMEWRKPVKDLIWERMALTVALSSVSILVSWFVAIPVGVFSATHQYSIPDYLFSALSFIGAGTPGFMIALVVMWVAMRQFGMNVGGLFSQEYMVAPWNWAKVVDLLKHLWIPVIVIAVGSTAGSIRTTRANVLDELNKPYVETARAKGLKERKLVWKYPVRLAMNPFFSTVGWTLASLISGQTLVSVVLSLQTTGPMMLRALTSQDMYLAGSFLLLLSTLTVIGTLISDVLLAWVDPRIRLGVM
ncbi:MAG: ABC transporter permease [Anaerolineae bacterium]